MAVRTEDNQIYVGISINNAIKKTEKLWRILDRRTNEGLKEVTFKLVTNGQMSLWTKYV